MATLPRGTFRIRTAAILCLALVAAAFTGCDTQTDQQLIASARAYLDQQDSKAAIIQLKTALQRNPQLGEARFLLGKAQLASGDAAAAAVELERALDLKHSDDEVLPALARALMGSGQAKKVTDLYSRTRLEDPKAHADLKAVVAAAFGAQGMIDRSQAAVVMALDLDPKNITARLLEARLAAGRGQIDDALTLINAVLADDPKQRDGWHLKGELMWVGKGDAAAGAAAFEQALQLEPRYLPAYATLIAMALSRRDMPAFKARVEALKKAMPNNPETRFYEAQAALLENDFRLARDITQQLLRIAPDNHRVLQLAGAIELGGGSLVLAESHLNKALTLQPQLPVARRLLAQAYLRTGQPARALSTLQPMLAQRPNADTLALGAEAYLQNGQLAESEALFLQATKANPDDPKLRTALALSQIAKGNVETGLADLEALAARDTSTYADLALISSRLRRNDTDSALKAIDRLQAKTPAAALPHHLRGRIMVQRKDVAAARVSFDKALAADPNYFPAVASLAALDVAEQKMDSAIQRFEAQLKREPKNYRALLAVAELKQRVGAPAGDITALLSDAVKANPSEVAPRLLLIDHLLLRKNAKAAQTAAQDALSALPDNPLVLDALGRAQLAAGDVQQAITALGKVAAAQPASLQAHLRLAVAHVQNNDLAAAARSLQRALAIDPASLPAQSALVQVAMADKRWDDAMAVARTVQKQRSKEAVGFLLEADVHGARRQWPPMVAALQAALEQQKLTPIAMRLHATLVIADRVPEAERFAGSWLRERPQDAAFVFHLGAMAMDRKQYADAEAHYRRVLVLRPNDATALNNIGWLMSQQGKRGGLTYAERANPLVPDSPAVMDTLAAVLAFEGQLPQAIEWQRRAVAKAGDAPGYKLRLARLLIQSGDKTAARTELDALSKLGDRFSQQAEVATLLKAL